jgi:hypothetical protein
MRVPKLKHVPGLTTAAPVVPSLTRRAACTWQTRRAEMNALWLAVLVLLTTTLAGCEAIGTIFKAGVWSGIIAVVLVVLVIGFIAAKIRS